MHDMTHGRRDANRDAWSDAWSQLDVNKLNFEGLDLTQPIVDPPHVPIEIPQGRRR